MSVSCKGLMKIHGRTNAIVYQVLTKVGEVFMSFSETTCMERRSVVVVDTDKFLYLWRASPYPLHKEIADGNPETWRRDYKFHHAENGFSCGIENPVPLAEINYETAGEIKPLRSILTRKQIPRGHISFTNGVTRTIWLLCNGAVSFPVEVSTASAAALSLIAGSEVQLHKPAHLFFTCDG